MSAPDIREKGAPLNGTPQVLEKRLFMQFAAFGGSLDPNTLIETLKSSGFECALYQELQDPQGVGLITMNENPDFFSRDLAPFLRRQPWSRLTLKPEFAMLGRSYSSGYESDLEDWLLKKPRRTALNPQWPWAVWYPLRRQGSFFLLPPEEQSAILREHGAIGRSYGEADLAHDIRLACFGLDKNDNDFVIGLIGKDLHPLSATVAAMRKTRQTASYMQHMGPFFVGRVLWQSEVK